MYAGVGNRWRQSASGPSPQARYANSTPLAVTVPGSVLVIGEPEATAATDIPGGGWVSVTCSPARASRRSRMTTGVTDETAVRGGGAAPAPHPLDRLTVDELRRSRRVIDSAECPGDAVRDRPVAGAAEG